MLWPGACRNCGAVLEHQVLDLGAQPFADDLLDTSQEPEAAERLELWVCATCWLVQLPQATNVPRAALHSHGGGFSSTWLTHQRTWFDRLRSTTDLRPGARVVQMGPNDESALEPYSNAGMRVGTWSSRDQISARGDDRVDLVLISHELSHTDDPRGLLADVVATLAPDGLIAIEFHHVLELVRSRQFDIACHTHRVYLSLMALVDILARVGCVIDSAERLPMHGGSVRVVARRVDDSVGRGEGGGTILEDERREGLDRLDGYRGLNAFARQVRYDLRSFLDEMASEGAMVVGYGAPTRGTTLLNWSNVTTADIAWTVDRNPAKQGMRLPGCGLPVHEPERIARVRPDMIVILPWALQEEIRLQLSFARSWGARFVVALPYLRLLD